MGATAGADRPLGVAARAGAVLEGTAADGAGGPGHVGQGYTGPEYPPGMELRFQKLDPAASLPRYAHHGDAGLDLAAGAELEVKPGERALVPTGLAVAIPEGHAGLVLPRSGLASREGLTLANAPGLIDAGYRGEVTIAVINLDPERMVSIAKGQRIAQLLVVPFVQVEPVEVAELPVSGRGEGGFGSTG